MPATHFSDMPILASERPDTSSPSFHRRRKSWARRLERCCCSTFTYFPLAFVYGLSTWAIYVELDVSFLGGNGCVAYIKAALGLTLYTLANLSYSIAVFTSAGTPLDLNRPGAKHSRRQGGATAQSRGRYEELPSHEEAGQHESIVPQNWMTAVTAKSTGKPRFCKKCQTVKPDRTHHCSTCGHCVLKMDHHCPWLATCVGLRNYKPFVLFLVYISTFAVYCCGVSVWWVWIEITDSLHIEQGMRLVNIILLAVIGGIMGLVLGGFTGWHIYLTFTGQTTIESLEKTRYLTPLRKSMERQLQPHRHYLGDIDNTNPSEPHHDLDDAADSQPLADRLREIHANALPGVLRPEEGDTPLTPSHLNTSTNHSHPNLSLSPSPSPARTHLQQSYAALEAQRERNRYNAYLDEKDSEALPNAFNLGWRRNLLHVLGPNPLLWPLPICNTTGDGWSWDINPEWTAARAEIARTREIKNRAHTPQYHNPPPPAPNRWHTPPPAGAYIDRARNATDLNSSADSSSSPYAPSPQPLLSSATTHNTSSSPTTLVSSLSSTPPPSSHHQHQQSHPLPLSPSATTADAALPLNPIDRRRLSPSSSSSGPTAITHVTPSSQPSAPTISSTATTTETWNDIPEDFLVPSGGGVRSAGGRGRGAGRPRKKGD